MKPNRPIRARKDRTMKSLLCLIVLIAIAATINAQAPPPATLPTSPIYVQHVIAESSSALIVLGTADAVLNVRLIDSDEPIQVGSQLGYGATITGGVVTNASNETTIIVGSNREVVRLLPGENLLITNGPSPNGWTCLCDCGDGAIAVHPGNDQGNNCGQFNGAACIDPTSQKKATTSNCKKGLGPTIVSD